MEGFPIPPTIFVALGVIVAALLAGFFSFLNLVSAKENKVSEFRLAWLDGLRDEISKYTAGVQELLRLEKNGLYKRTTGMQDADYKTLRKEWYNDTREAYSNILESLSRIQLRLNKKHIEEKPNGHESILMECIIRSRKHFSLGEYKEAFDCCDEIRNAAAPLLKSTWDLVKNGEQGYQRVRTIAAKTISWGMIAIVLIFATFCIAAMNQSSSETERYTIQNFNLNIEHLQNLDPKPTTNPSKIAPTPAPAPAPAPASAPASAPDKVFNR
ncbi:hypothetical protein [Pseudomonas sp. Sample_11]|uniref:hypothetical protein n=1 Tax=Pseudomonas sp. Sample_11 TaxID=2448261 RepID=UPI0019D54CF7|nr:hypothetical protein [Pseudomonas sp. Sample_11]